MREVRTFTGPAGGLKIERQATGRQVIVGLAAVFYRETDPGTRFELGDGIFERVGRYAFDKFLRSNADAVGLFNHDAGSVLGRRSAGTLRLLVTLTGLRYEIAVPDTQLGRDLATSIARGDIVGSSFAFEPVRVSWAQEGPLLWRTLDELRLYDVGPVTFPAYEATSAGVG
jgi:HK97 family phage prohead protease